MARLVEELGVTDVVDLRTETELHLSGPGPLRDVDSLTHHHHSLMAATKPEESVADVGRRALVTGLDDAGAPEPVRGTQFWASHYFGFLANRPESVAGALAVVADASGAVVVHCAAGKDRTGTVTALALEVAGVPRKEIVADYMLSSERIGAIVGRLATVEPYGPAMRLRKLSDLTPHAHTVEAILAGVDERWGGAAGFLRKQGWSDADVERLRTRLTS